MLIKNKGSKSSDNAYMYSNNLWVGNLTSEVTDSDLTSLFSKYGEVESIISYSSRSYAFVYFKLDEDAKAAKDALQGSFLRGNSIKIEFAKPAKPSKSLWVAGIDSSVSKETLEEEFSKFGKIEEFKYFKDRQTAMVDYCRMEDATQAVRSMNGVKLGGDLLRVDFLRSQSYRRDQLPDFSDTKDGHGRSIGPPDSPWIPQDSGRSSSDSIHSGSKRPQPSQSSGGRKGDGQPSNILWVGYPQSIQIDEQMLHRAMILFGEIERIKSFPSRHYSFVEFRSIDEARRAKEGLQGRLFNDPRITIMFSSSGLAPGKDYPCFQPGIKGPRPDIFGSELPFRSGQIDIFGQNPPIIPNTFSGPPPPSGAMGTNTLDRPFPQGAFDPILPGPDFNDLVNTSGILGPGWRRPSPPAPGLLPSPASGIRRTIRPKSSAWDALDAHQFQRESKRSRMDIEEASYPSRPLDDRGYGIAPQHDGAASGSPANFQGRTPLNPVDTRAAGLPARGRLDEDYIWRGVISKGGSPVCNARCVPIGKGLDIEISKDVNCSARTGLEVLTKHYAEAVGFDIVFFLPDSEEDFAPYTEFLRYLGDKNRAGVAKLDDGSTLFLVPPSEFLTKVLNISGPERLYGVMLKMPQYVSDGAPIQQQPHHSVISSQYVGRQQVPHDTEYDTESQKEEEMLPLDYNRVLPLDSRITPKPVLTPISEPPNLQLVPRDYPSASASGAASQSGVTLTPELLATLASLLPKAQQSSESSHHSVASSTVLPPPATPDKGLLPHGWKQGYETQEQAGTPPNQLGNQYNPQPSHQGDQLRNQFNVQSQLPHQYSSYTGIPNLPSQPAQAILGSSQIQDSAFSLPQSAAFSSRPFPNFPNSSQGGHFSVLPQANQLYQSEGPHISQNGFGGAVGTETNGFFGAPVQHINNHVIPSNQFQGDPSQAQNTIMPMATGKESQSIPNQVQQLQSALYGGGQGTAEGEADKNQRYQSTLQFAANLLLQIQQQQQPQSGHGPADHQ